MVLTSLPIIIKSVVLPVSTQYEHNYSIDGGRFCNVVTTGNNLEFVESGVKAVTSLKVVMYNIVIKQNVPRAWFRHGRRNGAVYPWSDYVAGKYFYTGTG